MIINGFRYKIEIIALNNPGHFAIQLHRHHKVSRNYAVGPRDSLPATIGRVVKEAEK